MIVPAFVGGGVLWSIFGSWIAVLIWLAVLAFGYRSAFLSKPESP
jgi:hypothetical protein